MSTTLRLDHLYHQGVPDVGSCPITVSREHYDELPAFPIDDLRGWNFERAMFQEIYRNHIYDENSKHPAVKFWKKGDIYLDKSEEYINRQKYWYIVWVNTEKVWIVFQYWNMNSVEESYSSTVETSFPYHGEIYRLNNETEKIVGYFYGKDLIP